MENLDSNSFRPIGNYIILDLSCCKEHGDVHRVLKENFGLPKYYGKNWDALWDCLDGRFDGMGTVTVEIRGLSSVPKELRAYCGGMLDVFSDLRAKSPEVKFIVVS